jgi:PST family polysaccharide transporter
MSENQASLTATTESATQGLGRLASRGLRWSVLGILVTKVGSFGIGLVLARLLAPADFGIYAIAFSVTWLLMHINDVGIIAATAQWRGRLEEMMPTATTLAVLFSCVVYGITWFVAPSFADLAGRTDAVPVIRLLTAIILVDGVTAVPVGTIHRAFQQDKLARANVAGYAANAGLTIYLALHGAGPYSFAGGLLAGSVITGVLLLRSARVPFKIGFDRAIAMRLLRFGVPLAASLAIEAVMLNADYVVVGRIMGATALGFYLLAFNISNWAQGVVGTAVRYVSIPSFSRLAEQDDEALSLGVQRSIPLLFAVIMPIAVLMAVLAPALVVFLYGAQWASAAPVLRFLAVLTVVRLLITFAVDILAGSGTTRATLWLNLVWAVALIPPLIVGTQLYGIRGTAMAHALVAILVAAPLAVWTLHRAGVRLAPIAPALLRPLLAAGIAAAICLSVAELTEGLPFVQLATAGTASLFVYLATVLPLAVLRRAASRARALINIRYR